MTTNITELAQSLKAAAIDAKELAIIARYSKGRAAAEKFYALANPNNVIALVEALEKAQETIAFQQGEIKALLSSLESHTVKLPTTRLWAGVTECYEKSDVIAAIRSAGMEVSDD